MKKIFLTSGLVLCMACPAYATASYEASIYSGENPDLVREGTCEHDHLGVYSGNTILKAIWTVNDGTVSFNNDISWTNSCESNSSISHNDATGPKYTNADDQEVSLANLFTRYGTGVYPTSEDRTNNTLNMSSLISPVRTGYRFNGYYTHDTNGDEVTKYVNGDGSFVEDSNRSGHYLLDQLIEGAGGTETLYASWAAKTYTVSYNCGVLAELDDQNQPVAVDRADGATDSTFTYDDCYSLSPVATQCGTAPNGYTFGGWQCTKTTTGANGGTVAFDLPGATKTLPSDAQTKLYYADEAAGVWTTDLASDETVTCTAIWNANTINVTWTSDGTTAYTTGTPTSSCTYDDDVTLPTEPSRTGYTFGGWEVQAAPTAAQCEQNQSQLGCVSNSNSQQG